MKHKYAILGGVVGLLLPPLLIVFSAPLWGVDIPNRPVAFFIGGVIGAIFACVGIIVGLVMEEDND